MKKIILLILLKYYFTKIKQKILKSIDNNRLKLTEWKRNWYSYIISIQKLVWARNYYDWYLIDVYDSEWIYLERIKITDY